MCFLISTFLCHGSLNIHRQTCSVGLFEAPRRCLQYDVSNNHFHCQRNNYFKFIYLTVGDFIAVIISFIEFKYLNSMVCPFCLRCFACFFSSLVRFFIPFSFICLSSCCILFHPIWLRQMQPGICLRFLNFVAVSVTTKSLLMCRSQFAYSYCCW